MEKKHGLPFEVGQKAEAMSFQQGFRGAWFRCEIKQMSYRKGEIGAFLDYYDFPDEKVKWLKLYQFRPSFGGKPKERKRHLMLRPQYPTTFFNSQSFDVNAVSDLTVVVDGVWKVGDLVDWWTDGCYWSGRLTEILDNDKAWIELTPPPMGEGSSYEALLKDLRPSLEWSLESGWTLPTSKDESRCCARLIRPVKQAAVRLPSLRVQQVVQGTDDIPLISSLETVGVSPGGREKPKQGSETLNQPQKAELTRAPETTAELIARNNANGKPSSSEGKVTSRVGDTSLYIEAQTVGVSPRERKKPKLGSETLNQPQKAELTKAPETAAELIARNNANGKPSSSEGNVTSLVGDTCLYIEGETLGVSPGERKKPKLGSEKLNQPQKAKLTKAPETAAELIARNIANGKPSSSEGNVTSQVGNTSLFIEGQTAKDDQYCFEALHEPLKATRPKESTKAPKITTQFVVRNNANGEPSSSEGKVTSQVGDASLDIEGQIADDDQYYDGHLKKLESIGGIPLNSSTSDTLEAALMDLEELSNKIKWMKRLLESGNSLRPPWEFVEHRGSSMRR